MHVTLLREGSGCEHNFLVAHFLHDPTLRKKQWTLLPTLPVAFFPANTLWLYNHNSVILPGRDVANSKITSEASDVPGACDGEVHEMSQGVVDSYICMHPEE